MTREELIDFISQKANLSKEDAKSALEAIINEIQFNLATNGELNLPGFGTFKAKNHKSKEVVTKEIIESQIKTGKFKKCETCGKLLKAEEFICEGCGNLC